LDLCDFISVASANQVRQKVEQHCPVDIHFVSPLAIVPFVTARRVLVNQSRATVHVDRTIDDDMLVNHARHAADLIAHGSLHQNVGSCPTNSPASCFFQHSSHAGFAAQSPLKSFAAINAVAASTGTPHLLTSTLPQMQQVTSMYFNSM
jgi:hypothetical protein